MACACFCHNISVGDSFSTIHVYYETFIKYKSEKTAPQPTTTTTKEYVKSLHFIL